MKVYILTEISSGEVPIELDDIQRVFADKDKAIKALNESYVKLFNDLHDYNIDAYQKAFDFYSYHKHLKLPVSPNRQYIQMDNFRNHYKQDLLKVLLSCLN